MAPRLDVNFTTFGDRSVASSRLRAWDLAEELRRQGHRATVNAHRIAPIEVFQKVRNRSRLAEARRNGSTVVYDFDDHYLHEATGAREDLLEFFARADVVTVGSEALLEAATRHHDRVRLFENPIDVARGAAPRDPDRGWRGRVGWFGNRAGLSSLEAVDTTRRVITITARGDVEWSLETVDQALADLDVAVLPVAEGDWARAKNANRLLKCVGLGLPAVASRTPEHERAFSQLGLPDWLLVDRGSGWDVVLDRVEREFPALRSEFARARAVATRRYGLEAVTRDWAERIGAAGSAPPLPLRPSRPRSELDVVVFSEYGSEPDLRATLGGLRVHEAGFKSVQVVSALAVAGGVAGGASAPSEELRDFFDLYGVLARALDSARGRRVLLLRAGVVPTRAFFTTAGGDAPPFELCEPVRASPAPSRRPPATFDALLARPYDPPLLSVSREALTAAGGLRREYQCLAIWELLIRLAASHPIAVGAPSVATADERALDRHPLEGYVAYVRRHAPSLAAELPDARLEAERLRIVLHAAVVGDHHDLFAARVGALLPMLGAVAQDGAVAAALPPRSGLELRLWGLLQERTPPAGVVRAVRGAWRLARPLVPDAARVSAYRRYRALYELFFPERRPPARR